MTWPWNRRTEQRAGSVTDSVIAELQRRAAGGSSGDPSLCAAVQTAAGIWARSFAAAAVSPASGTAAAVSPAILHQIGRDLVLSGQSVLQFGVMPGGPTLRRPAEYDLTGSPDPATWRYRLRYIGPTRDSTAPGTVADVVHIRLNEDARAPHCGVSPILAAADTAGALAGLERALRLESAAVSGYVIPSASAEGMDAESFTALKTDLSKLAGGTRIVPSLGPRAGDPQGRSGDADWKAQRIGLNPPSSVIDLRTSAGLGVMAAAGIPLPMVSERADATALREALRQFVHVTLQPVLRIVGAELSRVLELEVSLDLAPLAAADVQGRSRAFRALVGNGTTPGLDVAEARRLTGLQ